MCRRNHILLSCVHKSGSFFNRLLNCGKPLAVALLILGLKQRGLDVVVVFSRHTSKCKSICIGSCGLFLCGRCDSRTLCGASVEYKSLSGNIALKLEHQCKLLALCIRVLDQHSVDDFLTKDIGAERIGDCCDLKVALIAGICLYVIEYDVVGIKGVRITGRVKRNRYTAGNRYGSFICIFLQSCVIAQRGVIHVAQTVLDFVLFTGHILTLLFLIFVDTS
nr:MAG TPA: hypothetical protein [Caudoviricetes sp.]